MFCFFDVFKNLPMTSVSFTMCYKVFLCDINEDLLSVSYIKLST